FNAGRASAPARCRRFCCRGCRPAGRKRRRKEVAPQPQRFWWCYNPRAMSFARRLFAILLVLAAANASAHAQEKANPPAEQKQKPAAPKRYFAYIGTYTEKTKSKGIYTFRFEDATGRLSSLGVIAET